LRLTPHDGFGRRPLGKGAAPLPPRPTAHLTLVLDRAAKPPPLSTGLPVRIPGATKPPKGPVLRVAEEALLQRFLDALYQWDEPGPV
jgi:hypothetical protein